MARKAVRIKSATNNMRPEGDIVMIGLSVRQLANQGRLPAVDTETGTGM